MRSLLLALTVVVALAPQAERLDIAILNGRVLDGTGTAPAVQDIGVRGDRIVEVGRIDPNRAAITIDAGGRVVAPGFIDVHSHALEALTRPELRNGRPLLAQGVTTVVGNPDGGGPTNLAQQRAMLESNGGIGVNVALLVGHGAVRSAVLGGADRAPTDEDMTRMRALVRQGVRDGAFGLSSGLFYSPGRFAKTEEVIELAREAGGVYTSHIRDEGNYDVGVAASVNEVIRIAAGAGVTGIVSHMKALGPDSWGLSATLISAIEAARTRGVAVWADQYPYEASSTSLSAAVLPGAGSAATIRERLANPAAKETILADVKENIRRRGGADAIQIASARDQTLNGRRLDAIATAQNESPEQTALGIVLDGGASIVSFNMSEDDIRAIMRQPWTMTSSDGGLSLPGAGVPHPRNNGAFARKLGVYVRERKVLTLEQAVRSMTSLPATVFGFVDRGVIRAGAYADIVVFDPAKVIDRATYEKPHELAEGTDSVIVNGKVAWKDGLPTADRAGRVLRK